MILDKKNKHKTHVPKARATKLSVSVCCRVEWRVRGDKRTHAHAFPGTISARKVYPEEVHKHVSSKPVAEEGANVHPGEVAKKCKNMSVGTALERGTAAGTDVDGLI